MGIMGNPPSIINMPNDSSLVSLIVEECFIVLWTYSEKMMFECCFKNICEV